ncbi:MAG: 3-oxoacid CoA-transferase subunit A [SAR202 cluster bacterium]|jgi:3-oxoadipate CoA-transferase alpha subunit|nr:3-oxoacid CoA-transferase subunit A [SAR202 cluster bacterium]|tara:strand:- start:13657 stop:14358 length:702 start_codon:yes stop_codon:yes gene_type:complete
MTSAPENRSAKGKVYPSAQAALKGIADGASVLVAGFAGCGIPEKLLRGLAETGVTGLTLICQGTWVPEPDTFGVADLVANGQVKKMVSPLPFHPKHGGPVKELWESGKLELEVVPQGVLAERLRAGGAGIGGVFLPTGARTRFTEGKELRPFDGKEHVLEFALKADFALLRAKAADTLGNLEYQGAGRNWNPTMAMAAATVVAEVDQVHEPGGIDPEVVITQAIFIDRLVLAD